MTSYEDDGRLFHPEHPGSPYTREDALYDLAEAQDHLWAIERRSPEEGPSTRAATAKLARAQRFIKEEERS